MSSYLSGRNQNSWNKIDAGVEIGKKVSTKLRRNAENLDEEEEFQKEKENDLVHEMSEFYESDD